MRSVTRLTSRSFRRLDLSIRGGHDLSAPPDVRCPGGGGRSHGKCQAEFLQAPVWNWRQGCGSTPGRRPVWRTYRWPGGISAIVSYTAEEQMYFIEEGRATLLYGEERVTVKKNDFMYLPAGIRHGVGELVGRARQGDRNGIQNSHRHEDRADARDSCWPTPMTCPLQVLGQSRSPPRSSSC